MAWTEVTYSCGHTGDVQIYGARKDREKAIWVYKTYKLCPDCYEEQLRKEEQAVLSRAEEYGLPELSGSPKQIAWAMELRDDLIQRFEKEVERLREHKQRACTPDKIAKFEQDVLSVRNFFVSQTESCFWIDCREKRLESIVEEALEAIRDKEKTESPRGFEATAESTVYPENQTTKDVAEIKENGDKIELKSAKNDTIVKTVKSLGYRWNQNNKKWCLKLDATTGNPLDRVAEVGNALLNAGVPVLIFNEEARQKAISGGFEGVHPYWICHSKSTGDLVVEWKIKISEELFHRIKALPSAKYNDGKFHLSPKYYDEIRDFASLYNFRLSKGAEEILNKIEEEDKARIRVIPATVNSVKAETDGLNEILKSSRDVLDDLREEG